MKITSAALAAAMLLGSADAFWRMECRGISGHARIDPLVNPGGFSAHAHTVCGGSGFSPNSGTAELLASDCTSCAVTQDKSAYWTPPMYFRNKATGDLTLVNQVGGMLAYYFLNYSPGEQKITAYPPGFSMIAGNTAKRSFDASNPEARAVGFNCLNYGVDAEPTLFRHEMPSKSFLDARCKDGVRVELMFPSCWDGQGLTGGASNKAHVKYPDSVMTGSCPEGFKTRLPGLMFEVIWDTNAFNGIDGEFIFSNGDPTGYGYHGDFVMGWEDGVLQKAVDTCTNISGRIEDCPIFNIQKREDSEKCFFNMPNEIKSENLMGPFKEMPGNSPISYGPGDASAMAMPKAAAAPPPAPAKAASPPKVSPGVFAEQEPAPAPKQAAPVEPAVEAPAPPPAVTKAPEPVPLELNQKLSTTTLKTVGPGEVVEVVVIEEVVTITEEVVTMTEFVTISPVKRRSHGHGHHARRRAH